MLVFKNIRCRFEPKRNCGERGGEGNKDRRTLIPESLIHGLDQAQQHAKFLFDEAIQQGIDYVYLPNGLEKKYPNAGKEFKWQFLFPSKDISTDPRSGRKGRHHIHRKTIQPFSVQLVVQLKRQAY